MITTLTKQDLIDFEEDIAQSFNQKLIKAPVHLYYGNEDEMMSLFQEINPQDWIFCSWRSHYQCLLKGVPKDKLKQSILDGKSISLCFPEQRVFSSAIVAGSIPIAVGVAMGIKMRNIQNEKVYCFVGDMTAETGTMWESVKYSIAYDLPIVFVIEDNNLSVCTDTRRTWNTELLTFEYELPKSSQKFIKYYKYKNKWPHAGSGTRIQF